MSWLSTTDDDDFSHIISEEVTFSSFWFLKDKLVYYWEPNEMRSLPVSKLQGNI